MKAGYYGVDLFFVISGFLITSILLKQNDHSFWYNLRAFLGRRFLRIFPLYYTVIAILWVINFDNIRTYLIFYISYTFNYAWPYYDIPTGPLTHFWSLSVEEQFYIFWPFLILLLKKKSRILIAICSAIILIGYLQLYLNIFPAFQMYNNSGLLTRMSSLALGALGIILFRHNMLNKKFFEHRLVELFALCLLTITLLMPIPYWHVILGLCSLFLVLKATIYKFSIGIIDKILKHPTIVFIGTIAYGIYIYHQIVSYSIDELFFNNFWASLNFSFLPQLEWHPWIIKFPLYSIVSIVLASLSFKYFEKPILKLKMKYFRD